MAIFAAFVLFAVVVLFIRLSIRMRRKGGSFTAMMYGATYEFYNQAHRAAIAEVVEQKAEKKQKEQDTGDRVRGSCDSFDDEKTRPPQADVDR